MSKEKKEYEKRKKFFISYILDNIYVKYYDIPFAIYEQAPDFYFGVDEYSNKDYKKYKREDSKTLRGEMAVYLIDILVAVRCLPDIIGPSSCGQYILFHYYYKKEDGQARFLISEDVSYVLNEGEYETPHLIKPNTVKEVAWNIDDMTYLWDGVPPSYY